MLKGGKAGNEVNKNLKKQRRKSSFGHKYSPEISHKQMKDGINSFKQDMVNYLKFIKVKSCNPFSSIRNPNMNNKSQKQR